MATIGYFGDSFCAGREPESWCVLLANRLKANIVHWGEPGRSIWSTFFSFERVKQFNRIPDYSVFCWTEPYRLYHKELILSANTERLPHVNPKIYDALDDYWVYLHDYKKDELAYTYSLKHFDNQILSSVKDKTRIVQTWSFRPFETAGRHPNIQLSSGEFIDESMFNFAKSNQGSKSEQAILPDWNNTGLINHMTIEQNQQWADKVYERLSS